MNCSFKEQNKTHGINFLDKRNEILEVNRSNKNDIIKLIGKPHSKSINNDNKWFYFERKTSRGKIIKLGRNVLHTNNVLELEFDKYGVLKNKKIYNKDSMNKVSVSDSETVNTVSEKSFVRSLLSSINEKMYGRRDR